MRWHMRPTIPMTKLATGRRSPILTAAWLTMPTTSYTYDALGNRTGIAFPNRVTTSYGYDNADRLTSIRTTSPISGTLLHVDYVLDAAGNRVQMADNEGLTNYSYDRLYRLAGVT